MSYNTLEMPWVEDKLQKLHAEGLPIVIGRPINAQSNGTLGNVLTPEKGQVAVVTKIIMFSGPSTTTSTLQDDWAELVLEDPAAAIQHPLPFFLFNKQLGAGDLQAPTSTSFTWVPRKPLIVPGGWKLRARTTTVVRPVQVVAFGVVIDQAEARAMGLDVGAGKDYDGDATIEYDQPAYRWIQTGLRLTAATTTELVPARTGQHIMLSDIVLRLQPDDADVTVSLEGTSSGTIFEWHWNALNGDFLEVVLKPRIFMDSGDNLTVTVSGAGGADRGSIIVMGKYVAPHEVPDNAWWVFSNPTAPPASVNGVSSTLLKAGSGRGHRLVVEGMAFSHTQGATGNICLGGLVATASATQTIVPNAGGAMIPLIPYWGFGAGNDEIQFEMDEIQLPVPSALDSGDPWDVRWQAQNIDGSAVNFDHQGLTVWGRETHDERNNATDGTGDFGWYHGS